jgi:GR25 family glycosyltransferase involved in LPS biosynthesis
MSSYVINLERRKDRKTIFLKKYEELGPDLPLTIFNAIDGTKTIDDPLLELISNDNDFQGNPRVTATCLSHIHVWKQIAEGPHEYGFVFEDDIIFREDSQFKTLFKDFNSNLLKFLNKDSKPIIIYTGAGDILPIHVPVPSLALRKNLETSHVERGSLVNKYFGTLRKGGSPYIFDWFGAFSYVMPKKTAKYLFEHILKKDSVTKAIDVFLKDHFLEFPGGSASAVWFSAPLFTYHAPYDLNIYDSDTWGISIPKSSENDLQNVSSTRSSITFIIPTLTRSESLDRTIDSIITNNEGILDLSFIIYYDSNDFVTKEYLTGSLAESSTESSTESFKDLVKGHKYKIIETDKKRTELHDLYNEAIDDVGSDFIAIWNDDTIIKTEGWSEKLLNYHKILACDIACYQTRFEDTWSFSNVILTNKFAKMIDRIPCSNIYGYLKYVAYLSRTDVVLRDFFIQKIKSESDVIHELFESVITDFTNSVEVKTSIKNSIKTITSDPGYVACGIWTKIPDNWESTPIIGDTVLKVFNDRTI